MMKVDSQSRTNTVMRAPTNLVDLVGDTEAFFDGAWGNRTATFACEPVTALLSTTSIWREIDCGSLVAPYFAMVQGDGLASAADATETRIVQTKPRPGYAKPVAVRALVATGHALTLAQLEDWNVGIGVLVNALRVECRAQVSTDAYLCPAGARGVSPDADGAHALVLQLEGQTRWVVGDGEHGSETTLKAGTVLYVPAGWRRRAVTDSTDALYLVISLQQPTARDLAELALAQFLKSPAAAEVAGTHHFMTPAEKASWLRTELRAHLAGQDYAALAEQAVRIRQREGLA